jgi:HEAT repeat protein
MAAQAMCRIGPEGRAEASVVVPALITQLRAAATPGERSHAAEVLADLGPDALTAVPALLAAAQDRDQKVRLAAAAALKAIDAETGEPDAGESNSSQKP